MYQKRRGNGVVILLKFDGQVMFIPGRIAGDYSRRPQMGVSFVTTDRTVKRVAATQCNEGKWQILVADVGKLRLVDIYISPRAIKWHWKEFLRMLSEYRRHSHSTVVCGDFNARYKTWSKYGSENTGGMQLSRYLQIRSELSEGDRLRDTPRYKLCAPLEPTSYHDKAGIIVQNLNLDPEHPLSSVVQPWLQKAPR